MKKTSSKSYSMNNKSDNLNFEKESQSNKSFQAKSLSISPLSLNTLTSNATNYMETGPETSSQKHYKGQSSGTNYENQYFKVTNAIRDMFLEMKNRTLRDDPNCALILKKSVPIEQDNDYFNNTDSLVLLQYMKKIHEKTVEFKNEAENELSAKRENECSDYEAMLQKLEAEVRQHIRIEQQLKLYVENTQAKLDELEKTNDPNKMESIRKENDELKNANYSLNEKLKKRENEIESYKKDLHNKNNIIKDLEHQAENLPVLKNKIKELEKIIAGGMSKPPSSNVLKGSNKSNKDLENNEKNSSFSNQFYSGDSKSRKGSQPGLGMQAYEIAKQRQYDKENLETYKLDLSRHIYEGSKGYRSNSQSEIHKSIETSKIDLSINKGSSKRDEKNEDFNSVLERMKKSLKSGNSRNVSKEDLRTSDQTINPEEIFDSHDRTFDQKMSKKESDKYNYDKRMKANYSFQEYDKKSWDKMDYKSDAKHLNNKSMYYKESVEVENSNPRNNIPKPRPSSGYDNVNNSFVDYKYKKESEIYDLNKLKVNSPKKNSQDRSQSVDAKQRFAKQLKSNQDILNKPIDNNHDNSRFSVSSQNIYRHSNNLLKNAC